MSNETRGEARTREKPDKPARVSLRKGRDYQIMRGHPWLFSGGISQTPGNLPAGSIVELLNVDGQFVARGYFNPNCDIAVRVLTRVKDEQIDKDFLRKRVKDALALRHLAFDAKVTNAFRLINAEGDFLPGLIVDFFAGTAVVQSHTAGGDALLPQLLEVLEEVLQPQAIVVKNDASVRKREGIEQSPPEVVYGTCPENLTILENGLSFYADPVGGQKTGYYTDQRDKRAALASYCKQLPPEAVLANCFSYTGSFSVYAIQANPSIHTINVDESQKALDTARQTFELNKMDGSKHEYVRADVFDWLAAQQEQGNQFDVLILDPPAFAKSKKDNERALKAYTRLFAMGAARVKPGGLLVACSCSGSVSLEDFSQTVRDAAGSSGRSVQLVDIFQHGSDHPINIAAPESGYLKVLFCRLL